MALPLFDDVVIDAVPPKDGPVRIHEDRVPTAAHTSARLSAASFDLDGDERPRSHRPPPVRHGTPLYFTFWTAFRRGADGQTPPGVEHDDEVARYAADGYNIGRLFKKLPCMTGERDRAQRRWR